MCVEGLEWVLKALLGIEGIGCVRMGWDEYKGLWMREGVLEVNQKV